MRTRTLIALACLWAVGMQPAGAVAILVADSGGTQAYGIGYSRWATVTAQLESVNVVTVVPDFSNLSQMLASDAIWLDQRWTQGSLSATEILNLETFIGTGRRVVMFGENDLWATWNTQVLAIVAGTYDSETSGTATPVATHDLTFAVGSVDLDTAGRASGGTALFDQNFMTLWGTNVVTVLDINFLDEDGLALADNHQLASNLVTWISGVPPTVVPLPAGLPLFFSACAALGTLRRRVLRD